MRLSAFCAPFRLAFSLPESFLTMEKSTDLHARESDEHIDGKPNNEFREAVDDNRRDYDAEFGGTEARQLLEKRLLRKLDLRSVKCHL
jgi:hypothetical protein